MSRFFMLFFAQRCFSRRERYTMGATIGWFIFAFRHLL